MKTLDFSASRRNFLVAPTTLGIATRPLFAAKSQNYSSVHAPESLLRDLEFERLQSKHPGAVFDPDLGLLVGFGDNLFRYDPSTRTSRLFHNGYELFSSSTQLFVEENVPTLQLGDTGRLVQAIHDNAGRTITANMTVQATLDVPADFMISGRTDSGVFTGRFYHVTMSVDVPEGNLIQVKTTYDLLARSFPLDLATTAGPLFSNPPSSVLDFANHNLEAQRLLGIAVQILESEFGAAVDSLIPTDLQADFSLGKVFRKIVHAVAVVGSAVAAGAVEVVRVIKWIILAVAGNAIWDAIKAAYDKLTMPPLNQCPGPTCIE